MKSHKEKEQTHKLDNQNGELIVLLSLASQRVDQREVKDSRILIHGESAKHDQSKQEQNQGDQQQASNNIVNPHNAGGKKENLQNQNIKQRVSLKNNNQDQQANQIVQQAQENQKIQIQNAIKTGKEELKEKIVDPSPIISTNTQSKTEQKLMHRSTDKITINIKNFAIQQKKDIKKIYRIKDTLGQGSFGCVKKIEHRDLKEYRAMKIIKKSTITSEQDFLNEISMLKSIDHPNVLKYYECYVDNYNYYIVTEFCGGGELLTHIVKSKGINEVQASYIMKQVLSAVAYCHGKSIVHRDMKVENILVKEVLDNHKIQIKIIDFGISCKIQPQEKLTKMFGTPYYMAPEVIKKNYTEKCDLWSCGVILYVMLSGIPPFRGKNLAQLKKAILSGKYSLQNHIWDNISYDTKDFIKRLLTLDPNQRISAQEALNHSFCKMQQPSNVSEPSNGFLQKAFQNLRYFNAEAKMQTALKAYFANFHIQDEYENELSKIFQQIDTDKDGTISKEEFRQAYVFFGEKTFLLEQEIDKIFEVADTNNNGLIDYSEFITCASNVSQLISEQQMKAAFNALDLDGNGEITFSEFEETFAAGLEIEKEELKQMFQEFDDNENGKINYEEFKAFLKKLFYKIRMSVKKVPENVEN